MKRMKWLVAGLATLAFSTGLLAAPDDSKSKKSGKPTVPVFRLAGAVSEVEKDDPFGFGMGDTSVSLRELVGRIHKAAKDDNVKAIVLLYEGAEVGHAQIEEIRQAMAKVREAGKDIYVHSDSLAMKEYVLLSGASRISVVPTADLWILGLYGESPYMRGLLDKLGVRPDFLTCGPFKSAAEMYMREGPSPEAEKMQNWLLDGMFDTYLGLIASGRKVDVAKAKSWVDNGPYTGEKAKAAGLIDAVEHRQDFTAMIKEKFGKDVSFDRKYGQKKPPSLDLSSPFALIQVWGEMLQQSQKKKSSKNSIAIVHVDGAISLGEGGGISPFGAGGGATSTELRKALDEVAADDSVKAVVLRVNSPGGSAVASEIILDATRRVKAKKPLVVSMGDVAGSGGYYVACASDVIFADESTITGSIGVVGGKLATTEMWKKIGVTFKGYKRGENAGLLSSGSVFSPTEKVRMQAWMDDVYGVFKGHVTAIRGNRLKKPIDELAGGRVYTGKQALELGLVDKIGSMQDAIGFIADKASLKEYDVKSFPEQKNFIDKLVEEMSGGDKEDSKKVAMPSMQTNSLVDLAMPHLKHLDPKRVEVVLRGLRSLQILQQEGVILMMPELMVGR